MGRRKRGEKPGDLPFQQPTKYQWVASYNWRVPERAQCASLAVPFGINVPVRRFLPSLKKFPSGYVLNKILTIDA